MMMSMAIFVDAPEHQPFDTKASLPSIDGVWRIMCRLPPSTAAAANGEHLHPHPVGIRDDINRPVEGSNYLVLTTAWIQA
jgi:hypothetical protein